MQAKAKLSYLRMSPRKVRLVADVVRGLDVLDAENQLVFMNKRAAKPVLKLLQSCIANAENNFKLSKENLFIAELRVDEGPTLKRWKPRAFGRASAINKRTSHIKIILEEKVASKAKGNKVKDNKKDVKIVEDLEDVKNEGVTDKDKSIKANISEEAKKHIDNKSVDNTKNKIFRRKSI